MRVFFFGLATGLALLLLAAEESIGPAVMPAAATPAIGDIDCDADVDPIDALLILRNVAGLNEFAPCAGATDVNCDSRTDAVDALLILRWVARMGVSIPAGCPPIGGEIGAPPHDLPTSEMLIEKALLEGTIGEETALVYRLFAAFGDSRLPDQYSGNDSQVIGNHAPVEASERWSSLLPETKELLRPFFVPPAYEGSWFDQESFSPTDLPAAGHEASEKCSFSGEQPAQPPSISADWSHLTTPHFNIWYLTQDVGASKGAGFLAAEVEKIWQKETSLMGRLPLSDEMETCNGGDGKLDIYVAQWCRSLEACYYRTAPRALTVAYPPGCEKRPAWMIVQPYRVNTAQTARSVVAHEFFHMIEFGAYDLEKACSEYHWLGEATATWMMDHVYPYDNYEHEFATDYLSLDFDVKLNSPWVDGRNGYEDYLFLLYLARSHNPSLIADIWDGTEMWDSLASIDWAIPDGFQSVWHDFALANWNQSPVDYYTGWDALGESLRAQDAAVDLEVKLEGQGSRTWNFNRRFVMDLASEFDYFHFSDPNARTIEYENRLFETDATGDLGKGKIQAWIKLANGTVRVEDWTHVTDVTFCRDLPEQDVSEMVVIWSVANHTRGPGSVSNTELGKLSARTTGCTAWEGSVTSTFTATGDYVSGTGTVTATDVRFELDPDLVHPDLPPRHFKAVSGRVEWSMGGTMAPCTFSASGTYIVDDSGDLGSGMLEIWDDGAERLRYIGNGSSPPGYWPIVHYACPEGGSFDGAPVLFNFAIWFSMHVFDEFRIEPDGTTLKGESTISDVVSSQQTWKWDFRRVNQD